MPQVASNPVAWGDRHLPYSAIQLDKPWQGPDEVKPWDRPVTIVAAHLNTSELIDTFITSWLLQSIDCNLVIVDTGSSERHMAVLREWERRESRVEVHQLHFKAVKHPSDPVAIAMDLAFSLCTTPYMFATHVDCFPVRQDLVESFIEAAKASGDPVAGYQITPRAGIDTEGWVGHTATLFDMTRADELNLAWSQRKLCQLTGMDHFGNNRCGGYPDTEFLINKQLDLVGIPRLIMGTEENYVTTDDANIVHVRSYASSKLYSPDHHSKATVDMEKALVETKERIELWKSM